MKKLSSLLFAVVIATTMFSGSAVGALLNFDDRFAFGGTVSYDGSGGPLIGSDIIIDHLTGSGTPLNNSAQLDIVNGKLNFLTGPNVIEGPTKWTFQAGGSIQLEGTVTDPNNSNALVASGTLLSGYFDDVARPSVSGKGSSLTFSGFGFDTINPDILNFFGINPNVDFIFATTAISNQNAVIDVASGSFSALVAEADIANQAVPIPGSLFMFGSGLLILLPATFRKKFKMFKVRRGKSGKRGRATPTT